MPSTTLLCRQVAPEACRSPVIVQHAAAACWPDKGYISQEMERELYEEVCRRQAEELYAAELAQLEEWQVGLYLRHASCICQAMHSCFVVPNLFLHGCRITVRACAEPEMSSYEPRAVSLRMHLHCPHEGVHTRLNMR